MKHLMTLCCVGLLSGSVIPAYGQDKPMLRLVQTIPLPGVRGRLDHMAVDLEKKRLFVAAVGTGHRRHRPVGSTCISRRTLTITS